MSYRGEVAQFEAEIESEAALLIRDGYAAPFDAIRLALAAPRATTPEPANPYESKGYEIYIDPLNRQFRRCLKCDVVTAIDENACWRCHVDFGPHVWADVTPAPPQDEETLIRELGKIVEALTCVETRAGHPPCDFCGEVLGLPERGTIHRAIKALRDRPAPPVATTNEDRTSLEFGCSVGNPCQSARTLLKAIGEGRNRLQAVDMALTMSPDDSSAAPSPQQTEDQ